MPRPTTTSIETRTRPALWRGRCSCVGLVVCALGGSAYSQGSTPPAFDLASGGTSAGGGSSSGGDFSVIATIGQTTSGSTSGGEFDCDTGVITDDGPNCAPTDLDCDGSTDGGDLGIVLLDWGSCPSGSVGCEGDVDLNGFVDAGDIALVLLNWGP